MGKSVYSLVLTDRLVEEVDRLAYARGTSRSNLINQILAEALSFVTPEKRISDIFSRLETMMGRTDGFKLNLQSGDSMLSLQSSLRYKYNPTIRYQLALYRNPSDAFGELRVYFRTKSPALLEHLTRFFVFWAKLESAVTGREISYEISPGKLVRKLSANGNDPDRLADACARYITLFDTALKLYFENPARCDEIQTMYLNYHRKGNAIF